MKRCDHTHWLSHCTQGGDAALLESNRLQTLINQIPNPDAQRPSLFILIGSTEKSIALRALFGLKRVRRYTGTTKRNPGEVHLHLDPSSLFSDRPILLADGDLPKHSSKVKHAKIEKCHEIIRRPIHPPNNGSSFASDIYTHLLFPFADVFCFFAADLGGFQQIAQHLALWLGKGHLSTLPMYPLPSIIIVTDKITPRAETEEDARRAFLWMLREETTEDLFKQVSAIDIITLSPSSTMSTQARYRRVRERLMQRSDQARRNREDTRTLFSATHFAAFFRHASTHFSEAMDRPFNFFTASRIHNPLAPDLDEHLSNFLRHIKSSNELTEFAAPMIASTLLLDNYPPGAHIFKPAAVFNALYKDAFCRMGKSRTVAFEQSNDIILRSGLIAMVKNNLVRLFQDSVSEKLMSAAVEIHRSNLARFRDNWSHIQSSNTCLCCLRRRPQHCLPCGHCICENCIVVFGRSNEEDPWIFNVDHCFLCHLSSDIAVRVHPPTAGVGVLCIDGGGTRGIVPLTVMKLIQDRLGPIPLQRCITLSFGVSVGVIIAIDHFVLGRTPEESIKTFSRLASRVFKRRLSSSVPLVSRVGELVLSYFTDGLYPARNADAVLQEWAASKRILDCSYATSTGTKIGLPVATVSNHPSHRFFTNYNGVGERGSDEEHAIVKPKDGFGNIPLWEIARSASAAPGFFPPKHINGVGTFQDVGALENDPVIWALSEMAALFPFIQEPDFVISLGTGEPGQRNYEVSTEDRRNIWTNGMFHRLRDLVLEKMRDKSIRRAYKTVGLAAQILHKIHRLSVDFETTEPRLDDVNSIPKLISKVEADQGLSAGINEVAYCMITSLFYFELDSPPERQEGKYIVVGHILCSIRRSEPAFEALFSRLLKGSAKFLVNDWPIPELTHSSSCFGEDGNFAMQIRAEVLDRFTVSLKLRESKAYNISGSPFFVQRLVAAQGFDAVFGRADHGKRKRWSCECQQARRKRRRI